MFGLVWGRLREDVFFETSEGDALASKPAPFFGTPLGTILVIWGMPGGHQRRYWVPWGSPVVAQCPPGDLLGSSEGLLGGSWVPPGAILVPFWEHLGVQNGPKSP